MSDQPQQSPIERLAAVANRIVAFRREIKPELTSALNDFLQNQPADSLGKKKHLAAQTADLLASLDFAINCEGQACSLYVTSSKKDSEGRFRLQPTASKSPLRFATHVEKLLPLELIDLTSVPTFLAIQRGEESKSGSWTDSIQRKGPVSRNP